MKKDKRLIITLSEALYRKIKMISAKTDKSMNLLINEAIREKFNQ